MIGIIVVARIGGSHLYGVNIVCSADNPMMITCDGGGCVAIGIGAYTGMDMLRKHRDRTVEVISTEGTVEMQEKTKGKTGDSPGSKNTENNLIPVEKVPGGSLAN